MLLMGLRLSEGVDLGGRGGLGGVRFDRRVIEDLIGLGLLETDWLSSDASGSDGMPASDFDLIRACAGPGLVPETVSANRVTPIRIRATRTGRLVLNAVVAAIAKGFVPAAA
jgi:oxygen-independent coproporphyrinogen-3 oxidase